MKQGSLSPLIRSSLAFVNIRVGQNISVKIAFALFAIRFHIALLLRHFWIIYERAREMGNINNFSDLGVKILKC